MALPLHMIQMAMDLPALLQGGRKAGIGLSSADLGYLVHCQLAALFGEFAPKPFSIREQQGRRVLLLGYAERSAEELRDLAQRVAEPAAYSAVAWESVASKPLPTDWTPGARYKFEVRASPVKRLGRANPFAKPGTEVDAFLVHCWREGIEEGASRAEVYVSWLRSEAERLGGASLLEVQLASFQLERLLRRTHGAERKSRTVTRPVVTFRGILEVQDPEKFHSMLARGIGRHRAFGLGMLLLRA